MSAQLSPPQFVAKWSQAALSERAASQEHFIDLCRMLGQPTPAEHDATGAEYTFEKGVAVTGGASRGTQGERGFADVWWRGKFAWEYKRKGKYRDLIEAYRQLCQYREALENPPLLVVCDIARTEIHTNFTGTAKQIHAVALDQITNPAGLDLLRRVFTDPESFRPTVTPESITEQVAQQFASLARALRDRGHAPQTAAHFLMKCMFCLFAEDVDLLKNRLFERLLQGCRANPATLTAPLTGLFEQMRTGGMFGADHIPWFNGGLFDGSPALDLTRSEIDVLLTAARQDWGSVEPAIFGTLFERSLDPGTRAQIGAHYTSREDIMLVVEPVVMAPLRREWKQVQSAVEQQLQRRTGAKTNPAKAKANQAIVKLLHGFVERLASIHILDPACGSGNFLYVAIQQLMDLEKQIITYASRPGIDVSFFPHVRPTQLQGIELNTYAAELAQVVIWIGYLQWMRDNGFIQGISTPILEPLQTIECRDAILDLSNPDLPVPAEWPDADFIIGNPPFLGGNLVRRELGVEYVEAMFKAYDLPNFSDLCCYWFELARCAVERNRKVRVGLLATQGIRGSANRTVIERVKKTGGIFYAWSDRDWILDGAAVHVSIIGFDNGTEPTKTLDGSPVKVIHADLRSGADLTEAKILRENIEIQHEGEKKGASFDVDYVKARRMLAAPVISSEAWLQVCRPWINGLDLARRPRCMWIIDFGVDMSLADAARFEAAFEHVKAHVAPLYERIRKQWWLHERPRPEMRVALKPLARYIATARLTKHRLFAWLENAVLPDSQVVAFARSDDYFFGVLHSSIHELWALRMGTQLEDRPRYTPTTCFETFPLPWPPGKEPTDHMAYQRISDAARELNEQRERWLNPPEWIEPIARAIDAAEDFADVPEATRPLIRHSAIMAAAAKDKHLKKRTLTNLYNERPTWLRLAHDKLDRAVLAAYAATDPTGEWQEDWAEVWFDTGAGQPLPHDHALVEKRKELDQRVLANLLRLNLTRTSQE